MLLSTIFALLQIGGGAPDDSAHREAKKAQQRFESIRRSNLPFNRNGIGAGSNCDAIIGRYCYLYDSTESAVVPEPPRITAARTALIQQLGDAAKASPGDNWIMGQRIRYLLEASFVEARRDAASEPSHGTAIDAARSCSATPWWCNALHGLALHVAQRYKEADSVFAVAIRTMPDEQRCAWHDLRSIVDGPLAKTFGAMSCQERERLAARLWSVGQPLWNVPGRDLRTEHYARNTMALVLDGSANAHGLPWSGDSRELLMRYGWAEWFTRRRDDFVGLYTGPHVTGHDREPSYQFYPAVRSERELDRITPDDWTLRDPMARTRYAPRHLKRMVDLEHQLVRFPRGDSMLVFVAYSVADTALSRDSVTGYLCSEIRCAIGAARGRVSSVVPRADLVASIEIVGDSTKRAARARYSVTSLPCAGRRCLSDLLLFDATDVTASSDFEAVAAKALTNVVISNRLPLGVYWELDEAIRSSGPVRVSVTVSPTRVSVARRVATRLHLATPIAPVSLRWQATSSAGLQSRHVTLRLPENARGRYRVTLTIESSNNPPLIATRDIDLRS